MVKLLIASNEDRNKQICKHGAITICIKKTTFLCMPNQRRQKNPRSIFFYFGANIYFSNSVMVRHANGT